MTKIDSLPILIVEDCIDRISYAQYVSKLDLFKDTGRYVRTTYSKSQVDNCFLELRMNALATFQLMNNKIKASFQGCKAYNDDVIVFGNTWKKHLERLCESQLSLQ